MTVSHSQNATVKVNHAGSAPPPTIQISVVSTAPTSTTNMTGLRTMRRGSSLRSASSSAGRRISGAKSERSGRSSSRLLLQGEVELEDVHGPRAAEAEQRPVRVVVDEREHPRAVDAALLRDAVRLDARVGLGDVAGPPRTPRW